MNYVIAFFEDVTSAMIDDCVETSIDTLRHSVAGEDKVVLKYIGSDPAWVSTLGLIKYTEAEIREELATSTWVDEDSIGV